MHIESNNKSWIREQNLIQNWIVNFQVILKYDYQGKIHSQIGLGKLPKMI